MTTLSILGGLGHVGLPLGLVLQSLGHRVNLIDTSKERMAKVRRGEMPFLELGALELLRNHPPKVIDAAFSEANQAVREADAVIVTLGTPLDEYQNPRLDAVMKPLLSYGDALDGKLVVLRSTVFPGTTARVAHALPRSHVAFCPERILQGHAIRELRTLPQIISATTPKAYEAAWSLFATLGVPIVPAAVEEAELAKLMLNSWRYVSFAVGNAFDRLANDMGVDYKRVEAVMKDGYSRADSLPSPGFAAGPCLLKDTMQLVAAARDGFPLGMAARAVNEGVPDTIVSKLKDLHGPLEGATIGILGMAFKADNDDTRDSLSFRLKKQLEWAGATVLCSDEFAHGFGWVTKEEALERCSGVVIGVGHSAYRGIVIPNGKVCVDLFGVTVVAT